MNDLESSLFAITAILDREGYPYAVMGGLAVRVHSIPRPTYDVDLTISIDRHDLPQLFASLVGLGCSIPEAYLRGWVDEVAGMPLVKLRTYMSPTSGVDIDIFLAETNFQKSCIARRVQIVVNEKCLWVVTPEDLILLKLLASRPRDLLDVADILFTQGQLDESYMRRWASELTISARLESVLND
jgi:hypothetical protein